MLQSFAREGFRVETKGRINLVTEADLASEKHITIAHPGSTFQRTTSWLKSRGRRRPRGGWTRLLLDHRSARWDDQLLASASRVTRSRSGSSGAGEPVAGVIYDPTRDELFAAERGAGARLNGRADQPSQRSPILEKALVVSGFPYDVRERMDEYLPAWREFLKTSQGVRRLGSASLDMACVASGRMDGFWENGLHAVGYGCRPDSG
jgi:myo-inositol-1(or 4)-monophosphatase